MNKQIISLMCVAVLLALALVLANEKWPDGYRTAPKVSVDTTPVGAVVKGPVTLPELEKSSETMGQMTEQNKADVEQAGKELAVAEASSTSGQNNEQSAVPQGELVAIDNGTLRNDVPSIHTETSSVNPVSDTTKNPESSQEAGKNSKPAEKVDQASEKKPAKASEPQKESSNKKANTSVAGKATPKILLYTKEAVLEIKANGPIRCKTFRLTSPDRLVVDLIGKWDVVAPTVPSNTIIQRVRIGEASEKTRIVLDLKRPLKSDKIVQVNATTINVRMQ